MGKKTTIRNKQVLYKKANHHLKNNNLEVARACLEKVLDKEPVDRIALHDLAVIDLMEGHLESAKARLGKVITLYPDFVLAKVTLSRALVKLKDTDSAILLLKRTLKKLEVEDQRFQVLDFLIEVYFSKGDYNSALATLDKILALPNAERNTRILNAAAFCHQALDRIDKSIEWYGKSLLVDPNQASVHLSLSETYYRMKDHVSERNHLNKYHKLAPQDTQGFHFRMARSFEKERKFPDAVMHIESILHKDPDNFPGLHEYLRQNMNLLNFKSSHEVAKKLVSLILEESQYIPQGALFTLSTSENVSYEDLYAVHRKYAELMIPKIEPYQPESLGIEKSIRIGFVSPDFYKHPVSQFFLPLLKSFKKFGLRTYGYSNTIHPDEVTNEYKQTFSVWKSIVGISDEVVAQAIQRDNIHILVDLSGHTNYNRISLFNYHPAKVTCTYLGYLTTTGLSTMDYWILDDTVFPEFMEEKLSETPYRLKRPWIAYPLPEKQPTIQPIRKSIQDPVLFGSANNVIKYSDRSIRLFAKVLHALPNSRMLLKHVNFISEDCIRGAMNTFAEYGIPANRLLFKGYDPSFEDHIRTLQQIDIALDTTPFNGGTTTCDTLYAGVPVLTIAGNRFISRMSATILHSLGLDEWICATEDEFVAKAVAYAMDIEGRNEFRMTIQQRMTESKLCDVDDLARCMVDAFHDMLAKAEN